MEMRMTDMVQRHVRSLSFPDDSEMGLFFALAVPLDDPELLMSVALFLEAQYKLPSDVTEIELANGDSEGRAKRNTDRGTIDRGTVYAMLESKFESSVTHDKVYKHQRFVFEQDIALPKNLMGYPGRQCLLRSICETKRRAVHVHNGLLGDLLHIIFTPSTSMGEDLRREYIDAETETDECLAAYSSCELNVYDFITFSEP